MIKIIDVAVFTKSPSRPSTQKPINDPSGIKNRPMTIKKWELPSRKTTKTIKKLNV